MKQEDREFEDVTISEVEPLGKGEGWSIKRSDGWSFFVPDNGVEPKAGSVARFYGRGLGYTVRGLDIDGQEVFYKTPEQQEQKHKEWLAKQEREKREQLERERETRDRDVAAMPAEFQQRIEGFRQRNPDFRWDHEPYELMVCNEAIRIAKACPTEAEIKFFCKQDWQQQKAAIPTLDEGHSGNSFGAACHLAWLFVTKPELVERAHGALCPLVGCTDYGCWSTVAEAA